MRGLKHDRCARIVITGHEFVQNLHRGHYELAVEEPVHLRLVVAFNELAWRSDRRPTAGRQHASPRPDATEPGRVTWRRSTATLWRSMSSSAFFAAELLASNASHRSTWQNSR